MDALPLNCLHAPANTVHVPGCCTGGDGEATRFRATVVDTGSGGGGVKLESFKHAGAYLKIDAQGAHLSGNGAGGKLCIMQMVNLGGRQLALRGHGHGHGLVGFTPAGVPLAPKDVQLSLDAGFAVEVLHA